MFWADTVGLPEIVAKISAYSEQLGGEHWKLSPLLATLAADGGALQSVSNG
jgi:3-hydroxyacyl-CoA dehydrogenase